MIDRRTRNFVNAVIAAAVVAVIIVARVNLGFDEDSLQAAGFFALLGTLASVLAYRTHHGATGSISFLPILSAVAVAPGFSVVMAVALAVLLGEILQHRERVKVVFNVTQDVFAASLAILTFRAVGGHALEPGGVHSVRAFAVASMVYFGANAACVAGVIAVDQRMSFRHVVWRITRGALLYDLLAIPAVYGFAWVYIGFGAFWTLALAFPLLGLRQLYKTNRQLEQITEELLQLMVAAIEARDPYTSGHSRRVSEYARLVARIAGIGQRASERVVIAALLHDVGKIHEEFAPILRKPGRLSGDEFATMQTHSAKGANLVARVSQFQDIVPVIRAHHEAWDGSGYPDGLRGEGIPIWARIIAIADTIDAMTSDRPYREALSPESVRAEIVHEIGHQFDPAITRKIVTESAWLDIANAISRNERDRSEAVPDAVVTVNVNASRLSA